MRALIYWVRDLLGLVVKPVINISAPPPDPQPVREEGGLKSAVGMDYKKLRDLLAAGKWKEADKETARVMLAVAKRKNKEAKRKNKVKRLDIESIDNFPCEDLRTIDQLWVKYSNGHFGFSVQKRIYQSLGGTRKYDHKIWDKFVEKVGWEVGGSKVNVYISDVQEVEGYLPNEIYEDLFYYDRDGWIWVGMRRSVFFSRFETCKL